MGHSDHKDATVSRKWTHFPRNGRMLGCSLPNVRKAQTDHVTVTAA